MKHEIIDLIGEFHLFKNNYKKRPITLSKNQGYWAHTNIKGVEGFYSYCIYFIDRETMHLGDTCLVEFKFKFSDDERFSLKVKVGQILELREGQHLVGELKILEILNPKINAALT